MQLDDSDNPSFIEPAVTELLTSSIRTLLARQVRTEVEEYLRPVFDKGFRDRELYPREGIGLSLIVWTDSSPNPGGYAPRSFDYPDGFEEKSQL